MLAQYIRAALVTIAAMVLLAQNASAGDGVEPYVRPQQMVDVGNGRRLNLYCSGSGTPTVVLDSGFGTSVYAWHTLQSLLARHVRTCFYERAGYGFSDPSVRAQDTSAIVEDMHAMLHDALVPGPYVLVAHSLAGFDARLYADRYRPDVAGMVLIAPSEEDDDRFDAIFGKAKDNAEGAAFLKALKACAEQAHQHRLKIGGGCVRPDPSHPLAVSRARVKLALLPNQWDAMISEWENFKNDAREVRAEQRDYGRLPLIVLTADAEEEDAKGDGATDKQIAQANALLRRLRAADAAHSEIGVSCVVPGVVGEFIQTARPNAVVNAALDVISEAESSVQARPRACHYF
ncbi:MAG TPA: alpha/beta fold hydrolase [Candidatus Baltobacteraceae bacterium]|nr:alpha/beta fold hydrolase [Candidatus Baltobacteraceae bacterium]